GNIRIACVGLENQTEPDPAMPLRVFGYDGAEYRSQLTKANRNKPNYPVVTLVLYFGTEKHWDEPLSLHEALDRIYRRGLNLMSRTSGSISLRSPGSAGRRWRSSKVTSGWSRTILYRNRRTGIISPGRMS
ncbi:MAG: Rpn family recombination-promoting nuclease/putative transposase, partial [Lachnospiraceae bacterium]|nr:Rpn family recombination-promoting nuclease/putative transposase [Lachnospiraceae bacterium]